MDSFFSSILSSPDSETALKDAFNPMRLLISEIYFSRVSSPRTRTMSVAIYNEVIRASYGTAAALASILTVTTIVSLLIFFRVSGSRDVTM